MFPTLSNRVKIYAEQLRIKNQLNLEIKSSKDNKIDASLDPDLISKFNAGEDIYIYSSKLYLGEEGWNNLSKKEQKTYRKKFKTIDRCGITK